MRRSAIRARGIAAVAQRADVPPGSATTDPRENFVCKLPLVEAHVLEAVLAGKHHDQPLIRAGNGCRPGVPEAAERLLPFLRDTPKSSASISTRSKTSPSWTQTWPWSAATARSAAPSDGAIGNSRAGRQPRQARLPRRPQPGPTSHCFPDVLQGRYRVSQHLMFECQIGLEPESLVQDLAVCEPATAATWSQGPFLGLNEIVVQAVVCPSGRSTLNWRWTARRCATAATA